MGDGMDAVLPVNYSLYLRNMKLNILIIQGLITWMCKYLILLVLKFNKILNLDQFEMSK